MSSNTLHKRLASILSEDDQDYVTDVLDQLIVIGDNVEDVTAYLKSFVGGGDAALTKFAADVKRFKLGEEIMESTKTVESVADKKQSEEEKETLHMQQQRKNDEGQKKRLQHQRPEEPKNHGGQQSSQTKTKLPQKPIKGKANKICGCYGNKHKPLTNCLHCGRISCEAEGFDFCPFCHNLIEDFRKEKADTSALLHKERLLQFDRTSAARTNILDDQEDYFVSSGSMWLTQEEQNDTREKADQRCKMLHERQKQVLRINF